MCQGRCTARHPYSSNSAGYLLLTFKPLLPVPRSSLHLEVSLLVKSHATVPATRVARISGILEHADNRTLCRERSRAFCTDSK